LNMSDAIYEWYCATKKLIKSVDEHRTEETDKMVQEWQEALDTMEQACPDIARMYAMRTGVQESFTPAQIDHICYMIGDWYIEWKDKMWVDGKPNQHRLGIAKEKLKMMICGE
jgi:hypothetical protein